MRKLYHFGEREASLLDVVSSRTSHGVSFVRLTTDFSHASNLEATGEDDPRVNRKVIGDSFQLLGNCPAVMEPRYLAGKAIFSKMLDSNSF